MNSRERVMRTLQRKEPDRVPLDLGSTVTSLGTFTANASTVEYDNTSAGETVENVTYNNLEIDASGQTVSAGSNLTLNGGLTVTNGTFAMGTYTVTAAGATDIDATLTISTGTLDANGVARAENIPPGECQICFPRLDARAWERI